MSLILLFALVFHCGSVRPTYFVLVKEPTGTYKVVTSKDQENEIEQERMNQRNLKAMERENQRARIGQEERKYYFRLLSGFYNQKKLDLDSEKKNLTDQEGQEKADIEAENAERSDREAKETYTFPGTGVTISRPELNSPIKIENTNKAKYYFNAVDNDDSRLLHLNSAIETIPRDSVYVGSVSAVITTDNQYIPHVPSLYIFDLIPSFTIRTSEWSLQYDYETAKSAARDFGEILKDGNPEKDDIQTPAALINYLYSFSRARGADEPYMSALGLTVLTVDQYQNFNFAYHRKQLSQTSNGVTLKRIFISASAETFQLSISLRTIPTEDFQLRFQFTNSRAQFEKSAELKNKSPFSFRYRTSDRFIGHVDVKEDSYSYRVFILWGLNPSGFYRFYRAVKDITIPEDMTSEESVSTYELISEKVNKVARTVGKHTGK